VTDAYFQTGDGSWFVPTEYARGPWQVDACHAGPPTALMAGALEAVVPEQRLTRITVDIIRPIPMSGFRVGGSIAKPGRLVSLTEAELYDDDTIFARAYGLHLRTLDQLDVTTAGGDPRAVPHSSERSRPGFVPRLGRVSLRPGRTGRYRGTNDDVDAGQGALGRR
jgi:hypothetical protein